MCNLHYLRQKRGATLTPRSNHRTAPNTLIPLPDGSVAVVLVDRLGNETARALIDAEDVPLVAEVKWSNNKRGQNAYASGLIDNKTTYLHRHILKAGAHEVDHIDGNGLNNRRVNLRIVTDRSEQMQNVSRVGRAHLRGVYYSPKGGSSSQPWCAVAQVRGIRTWIGCFASADEAANAVSAWRAEHMSHSNEQRHRR